MDLLRRRPPTSALVYFGLAAVCAVAASPDERLPPSCGGDASRRRSGGVRGGRRIRPGARHGARRTDPHGASDPSRPVPPGALTVVDDLHRPDPRGRHRRRRGGDANPRGQLRGRTGRRAGAAGTSGVRPALGAPAGTLRSGDLVDVLATYGAGGGRPYTDTVATEVQVLKVLAAAEGIGAAGTDTGVQIVVLADPTTVETLARASALGVVTVSIAGPDEVGPPARRWGKHRPRRGTSTARPGGRSSAAGGRTRLRCRSRATAALGRCGGRACRPGSPCATERCWPCSTRRGGRPGWPAP